MSDALPPRYPSTLAPANYYDGLADRIAANVLPVLSRLLSLATTETVLELASGDGQHARVYANAFPDLEFTPTECDEFNRTRIDRTCAETRRVHPAAHLDLVQEADWRQLTPKRPFDLIIGHNFMHMIPFPEGPRSIFANLLKHNLVSRSHGLIAIYGPFKPDDDGYYSTRDESFDQAISSRPSAYPLGLRSVQALARIAKEEGWEFVDQVAMPQGNWVLVYQVEGRELPRLEWP